MDGDAEEYWHNAGSEGWESTCKEFKDGAAAKEGETRTGAEGSEIGRRSEREPNRAAFRIGWGTTRTWIVWPRIESA
jgi:hypothetical protein